MISRDWKAELEGRVAWIRGLVEGSGVKGIIFGNSGGKDSALVGILCKAACENTVGVIMPCASRRNYGEDADDGLRALEPGRLCACHHPITTSNKENPT